MAAAGGKHGLVADAISGEFYVHLKTHKTGIGITAETGFFARGDNRTVRALPGFSVTVSVYFEPG